MNTHLTDEQLAALDARSLLIQAGPGSGKTRSIVVRYIERAKTEDRGIALLSFTQRAVREVRERCASHPEHINSPNFLGTFDDFIRTFITTPVFIHENKRIPHYYTSWEELPGGDVFISPIKGPSKGIPLSKFFWNLDTLEIRREDLHYEDRFYFDKVKTSGALPRAKNLASQKILELNSTGIFDTASTRLYAYNILKKQTGIDLPKRLCRRFAELIVDEFQDCDILEHSIIEMMRRSGMEIVVVCDPDQSIFNFRGTTEHSIANYIDKVAAADKLFFTTNFRSTPPICKLVSSLRPSQIPVVPSVNHPIGPNQIFLVKGDVIKQRSTFLELAARQNPSISLGDCIVLAHSNADARRLSGASGALKTGANKSKILIECSTTLARIGEPPLARTTALRTIEDIVLSMFAWAPDLKYANRSTKLREIHKSPDWLRVTAVRLARNVFACQQREDFARAVREPLRSELSSVNFDKIDLSKYLKMPDESFWDKASSLHKDTQNLLPWSTIHGMKGGERMAVLLHVPDSEGVRDWENSRNSESRRVLYVGASRAQQMLALSVDENSFNSVTAILERDSVPFKVLD